MHKQDSHEGILGKILLGVCYYYQELSLRALQEHGVKIPYINDAHNITGWLF